MFRTIFNSRHDDLPAQDRRVEEGIPHQAIGGGILEDSGPETNAPPSNSRQRPALSASVTSTVSALKASRFDLSPATVS
jgi:hypothetical protein